MPTTRPDAPTPAERTHDVPELPDHPESCLPSVPTRVVPFRQFPVPEEPNIFPSPDIARRVARLVATLPGAGDSPVLKVEEIDSICDRLRLAEADRGVLIWRECIGWTAVMRLLCGRQGWTPDRVRSLSPSGLLAALEAGLAVGGEETPSARAAAARSRAVEPPPPALERGTPGSARERCRHARLRGPRGLGVQRERPRPGRR
jgi:hypothetical protein